MVDVVGVPHAAADTGVAPGLLIGGEWRAHGPLVECSSPASGEVVGCVYLASADDVRSAVGAARAAASEWRTTGAVARAGILRQVAALLIERAEQLAVMLTREEGKTLVEARGEILRAADNFSYHAGDLWSSTGEVFASPVPGEEIRVSHCPVGVVGVITPWNFPVAIPARKIAPALAYGNTVVWKPASEAAATGVAFAQLLVDAGVPPGVINVVTGGDEVGAALVDGELDALTFTGSTAVGHELRRKLSARGVAVQLELGGHSPAVVFSDADLELAVRDIVDAAMFSTGQRCTATRRVIVHEAVYDELLARLIERVRTLRVGDPLDGATEIGPLVSHAARDAVLAAIEEARQEGWRVAVGGAAPEDPALADGAYVQPTLLVDGTADSRIAREEVFGPVATVFRVPNDDAAIHLANATTYGLSASAFTASLACAQRFNEQVNAGVIHINGPTVGAEPHVPFGGWADSGSQAPPEMGRSARDFFTHIKTTYQRPSSQ
jgi:acyl-CoA reductase-like NAD-dependent aldehyde dehydrogenase